MKFKLKTILQSYFERNILYKIKFKIQFLCICNLCIIIIIIDDHVMLTIIINLIVEKKEWKFNLNFFLSSIHSSINFIGFSIIMTHDSIIFYGKFSFHFTLTHCLGISNYWHNERKKNDGIMFGWWREHFQLNFISHSSGHNL